MAGEATGEIWLEEAIDGGGWINGVDGTDDTVERGWGLKAERREKREPVGWMRDGRRMDERWTKDGWEKGWENEREDGWEEDHIAEYTIPHMVPKLKIILNQERSFRDQIKVILSQGS